MLRSILLAGLLFFTALAGCAGPLPNNDAFPEPNPDAMAQAEDGVPLTAEPLGDTNMSAGEGQVRLVTVWASWCSICKRDEPVWDELARDYPELVVQAVSREEDRSDAQEYVERNDFAYQAYWAPDINDQLGLRDYQPNFALFDADGGLVATWEGTLFNRPGGEERLREDIEGLLS